MTRIATRNVQPSQGGTLRAPRGGSRHLPQATSGVPPTPLVNFPLRAGNPAPDAHPIQDADDLHAIRREETFRAHELADLPDEGARW